MILDYTKITFKIRSDLPKKLYVEEIGDIIHMITSL